MEWLFIIGAILFLLLPTPEKLNFLKWFFATIALLFILTALILIGAHQQ